ncbi:MAG: DEAD/DEAH box helicase [Caldilineaceae bacterium]|nr:DEAD/DEAH box helicase [Caldilineaceae bacterium]
MKFEELALDPRILAAVRAVGFETPTPIQQQAIPLVLAGRDVLGLAQTGTGKTAAFALPILNRLTQGPLRRIRALIVAPTRELAEQINQTNVELGQKTKIRSAAIYGGVGKGPQLQALRSGVEIIVACPGRLLDHIGEGNIDLSTVEVLVLDEADRMCDMGFLPDIRRILKHLPKQRQTLFFSATMPADIRTLASEILHNPATVQIGMIAPAKTVSHALYPVAAASKKSMLFTMLKRMETDQVLIFTRTKRRARFLASDLEQRGYRTAALQGNMAQNRRQEAIDGFRNGKYKILVATDIAARGIDVAEISHVINFDMPDTVDAYTHRIGRTGRAHATGEAFTFMEHGDESMVREIEKVLGKKIERRQIAGVSREEAEPQSSTAEPNGHNRSAASASDSRSGSNRRANGQSARRRRSGSRVQSGRPEQAGRGGAQEENHKPRGQSAKKNGVDKAPIRLRRRKRSRSSSRTS